MYSLLIGINYYNTTYQLNGCINDVNQMRVYLRNYQKIPKNHIYTLTDNNPKRMPTYRNIMAYFKKMTKLKRAKKIWIYYSGHGTYIRDRNNDELDNRDESIVPCDFKKTNYITDDILNAIFRKFVKSCKVIFIADCCNSGTVADLPYRYDTHDKNLIENNVRLMRNNILSITGCADNQSSYESFINGQTRGALTNAFISIMIRTKGKLSCFNMLNSLRIYMLKNNFNQAPQICSTILKNKRKIV